MKVGDRIKELGGIDFGSGAVVESIDNDIIYLKLDSGERIKVDMSDFGASVSDDDIIPDNSFYDSDALHSPELHNIRSLPLWWGPRDPNMPSSITRVIWQPINYINRNWQRRWGMNKTAYSNIRVLPRRMRIDKWVEEKDHPLNTEDLIALTETLWEEYKDKQNTYLPERGKAGSLPLYLFAIAFMRRHNLSPEELLLLFEFMVATGLILYTEYQYVLDTIDGALAYYLDK